jgi:hypothetical protein
MLNYSGTIKDNQIPYTTNMNDVAQTVIKYIREQDSGTTINEILKHTDLEDDTQTYDKVSKIIQHLEREDYLSGDGVFGEQLSYTAVFFPTNDLHSTNIETILQDF